MENFELSTKGSSKKSDYFLILNIATVYLVMVSFNNQREMFIELVFNFCVFINILKFALMVKYNDIVYYLLKGIAILFSINVLIKTHNPFYQSFLFWMPFEAFFRAVFMIKLANYFYERDFNSLKKEERDYWQNDKIQLLLSYRIFTSLLDRIYSWKKMIFIFLLLVFIKVSVFLIQDNTIPLSYHNKIRTKKYFICANIFNNEKILDDWSSELLKLINYMGPESVYVSIFENADSTDRSVEKLKFLEGQLNQIGVRNKIYTHKVYNKQYFSRIKFLELLRNIVIKPLYDDIDWYSEEFLIVFFNDIVYKYQDIVKLIMTNDMKYDMACGLDFSYGFYDTWVTRDLKGAQLYNSYPYFRDRNAQNRLIDGEPIRVYSCWNGVAIMNPAPFMEVKDFKFRESKSVIESECFLICKDYWTAGYNRIIINPTVKVAYDYGNYYFAKYVTPIFVIHTYILYFFKYIFEWDPNSSILDGNIILKLDWRAYV